MTSLKTSIKTITYLSDIGCLEIQGASLLQKTKASFGRRGKVTAEVSLKLSLTTNQSAFKVELMDLTRYLWMCFVYG